MRRGNSVPLIARLVQADEDSVRQVIHRFNEMGMACLNPRWAGGRPRLISEDDEAFIVATAKTRHGAVRAWVNTPRPTGWADCVVQACGHDSLRDFVTDHLAQRG